MKILLTVLILFSAITLHADGTARIRVTLKDGTAYTNARLTAQSDRQIIFFCDAGVFSVEKKDLTPDLQVKFNYQAPANTVAVVVAYHPTPPSPPAVTTIPTPEPPRLSSPKVESAPPAEAKKTDSITPTPKAETAPASATASSSSALDDYSGIILYAAIFAFAVILLLILSAATRTKPVSLSEQPSVTQPTTVQTAATQAPVKPANEGAAYGCGCLILIALVVLIFFYGCMNSNQGSQNSQIQTRAQILDAEHQRLKSEGDALNAELQREHSVGYDTANPDVARQVHEHIGAVQELIRQKKQLDEDAKK